jgi:hypothetical protein
MEQLRIDGELECHVVQLTARLTQEGRIDHMEVRGTDYQGALQFLKAWDGLAAPSEDALFLSAGEDRLRVIRWSQRALQAL